MDFGSISGRSSKSSMKRKQSSSLLTAFRKSSQPPPTSYVPPTSSTSSHFPSEPESPYAESTSSASHSQAFYSDFNPGSSSRYAESTTSTARTATDQGHGYGQYGRGGAGRMRSSSGAVSTGSGGGSEGKHEKGREREREKSGGLVVKRPEDLVKVVKDRLFSWSYMMQWYQGETHWFNTVKIPRTTTESYLGPKALESRARNFFILGISLGLLFDMANATDYLRAVNRVLEEWESMVEGGGKVRGLFKGQKGTRKSGGGGEYMGMQDGDSALLQVNLPFTLDFFQVHSTTCSLIRDVYKKTLRLFLPSRIPTSAWSPPAPDPLALLHQSTIIHSAPLEAPLPSRTNSSEHAQTIRSPSSRSTSSTSHIAHPPDFSPRTEMDEPELTGIQQAFSTSRVRGVGEGEYDAFQAYILGELGGDRMLIGEGQAMTKEAVELFTKVDTRLRKHLSSLLRETDILARRVLDEELNALMTSLSPGSKPLAFDYTAALSHTGNGFALQQQKQVRSRPGSHGAGVSPKVFSTGMSGHRTSSMNSSGPTNIRGSASSSSRGMGPRGLGIGIPQSFLPTSTISVPSRTEEGGTGAQVDVGEERGSGWVGPEDISDEQHGR